MKPLDADTAYTSNLRVYIQSRPARSSQEKLQEIQQELYEKIGHGKPVSSRRFHVTLLHLGKPRDVLDQMRQYNPKIDTETFMRALNTFIADTHGILSHQYALEVGEFDIFGDKNDVVALRLKPSEYYLRAHKAAIRSLHSFLYECGIKNTKKYIHSHNNVQHAYEVTPHVTLIRSVNRSTFPALHSMPETIEFEPAGIFDTSQ